MSSASGNPKSYDERIVRDGQLSGGEPVFKGTRVTLRTVLASLAAGDTAEEILSRIRISSGSVDLSHDSVVSARLKAPKL